MRKLSIAVSIVSLLLPWRVRRYILRAIFKYDIHPTAYIGYSVLLCDKLILAEHSRIGHFNFIRSLDVVDLRPSARISHFNWIGGTPTGNQFFSREPDRLSALILGEHSAITSWHKLDCTNTIEIGEFTTVAGYRSQIITHGFNIYENRQESSSIKIGRYCYVGTGVILLKGSQLPDFCVLAAGSILNKYHENPYTLYSGNPAAPVRDLPADAKYFHRKIGFVS